MDLSASPTKNLSDDVVDNQRRIHLREEYGVRQNRITGTRVVKDLIFIVEGDPFVSLVDLIVPDIVMEQIYVLNPVDS